jgi:uncharacterized membrane protein YraQ (UPF0718 family)
MLFDAESGRTAAPQGRGTIPQIERHDNILLYKYLEAQVFTDLGFFIFSVFKMWVDREVFAAKFHTKNRKYL